GVDGTQQGIGYRVDYVLFPLFSLQRAEEPQFVPDNRAAQRECCIEGRETAVLQVLVVGNQTVALRVVIYRSVKFITAGLRYHARYQSLATFILRVDAAGDYLLLLDDLGVEVGAKGARQVVRDVDAVDVVDVVGRRSCRVAVGINDVAVVHARLRRRVTVQCRLGGRSELQVRLVGSPRRQRLG